MDKKVLILDVDDVLVECCMVYQMNRFLGTNYKVGDFKGYFMQDIVDCPKQRAELINYCLTSEMYLDVPSMPDAERIVERLNEKYDLYICTDPFGRDWGERFGWKIEQTYRMLKERFPYIRTRQLILAQNKRLLKADVFIDDRPMNLEGDIKTKLLFSAWHNKEHSQEELEKAGITRVDNWKEIEKILL